MVEQQILAADLAGGNGTVSLAEISLDIKVQVLPGRFKTVVGNCEVCGGEFEGTRRRRYDSENCRHAALRSRRRIVEIDPEVPLNIVLPASSSKEDAPVELRNRKVLRLCVVCDNEFYGNRDSLYDTLACKQARHRDRSSENPAAVIAKRRPSNFELALRDVFSQADLIPDQVVLARTLVLESTRLIVEDIQSRVTQGMDTEQLRQQLNGDFYISPRMLAVRLGLSEDYEVIVDRQRPMRRVIRDWKQARGMSERELAEASGLPYGTVHSILNARAGLLYPETLRKVAAGLFLSPGHLSNHMVPRLIGAENSEIDSAP